MMTQVRALRIAIAHAIAHPITVMIARNGIVKMKIKMQEGFKN